MKDNLAIDHKINSEEYSNNLIDYCKQFQESHIIQWNLSQVSLYQYK